MSQGQQLATVLEPLYAAALEPERMAEFSAALCGGMAVPLHPRVQRLFFMPATAAGGVTGAGVPAGVHVAGKGDGEGSVVVVIALALHREHVRIEHSSAVDVGCPAEHIQGVAVFDGMRGHGQDKGQAQQR